MKRDFDLIRLLLIEAEAQQEPFFTKRTEIAGFDTEQVAYHAMLLMDAGLIDGEDASTNSANVLVRRLTFEGHDFLDAVRDPSIWRKTRDRLTKAGGGFVLSVVKDVAVSLIREQLKI